MADTYKDLSRLETQHIERKSLRKVSGKQADWESLARSCVAFANAEGGKLVIGIEDGEAEPPAGQAIPPDLSERIRTRVAQLTVQVQALPILRLASNGGQYIDLVVDRSPGVASTSDGRYFMRVADRCVPILGDEVLRLANERNHRPWEAMDSGVPRENVDSVKLWSFAESIHSSKSVKDSVKEKTQDELLTHYGLALGKTLTRLGVLLVGTVADRWALGTAPIVQAIKYDAHGQKINKWVWDDCSLSPAELVDAVWREIPDFRESYEVAEGMHRRSVPAYDEQVIRELLVNALVHRPYTQRGDIFLNLHPDRLEIVNPGRFPMGVTPRNILHASRRRNDGLARAFHDLGLMEREGSGFDLIYERLLAQGRPAPVPEEGEDWVRVTIQRRILKPEVIRLLADADARFQLTQRERITLGVLAQDDGLTARELSAKLETDSTEALNGWLGRLVAFGVILSSGRTKGTRYSVNPVLLKDSGVRVPTNLKQIEPHRLLELVREDLKRYPRSRIGEISDRVGSEVSRSQLRRTLAHLVRTGVASMEGQRSAARYLLT